MPELSGGTNQTNYLSTATYSIVGGTEAGITWGVASTNPTPQNGREGGISPILYFKYIKSKFNFLQNKLIEGRLKKLEEAFNVAVENGQTVLAEKFLAELDVNAKETLALAKGLKYWINVGDLNKYKTSLNNGHISDTAYESYTRVIPKSVVKEKQKYDGIFDSFVIYHYYNESQKDLKELSADEKAKMRDPVLFGRIKGSLKLYFIADWEDEYCDLRFEDIIKVIGKSNRHTIAKNPSFSCDK